VKRFCSGSSLIIAFSLGFLQDLATSISLQWWMFALAGATTILIVFIKRALKL